MRRHSRTLAGAAALTMLGAALTAGSETKQPVLLSPAEQQAIEQDVPGAGSSGVTGIRSALLAGNPLAAGPYTIRLTVPANTRIEAHSHRDDRVVTVVSGVWRFGIGERFDEKLQKALPAGSFYTEPAGVAHFASTGDEPVTVHITGHRGPTSTDYRN